MNIFKVTFPFKGHYHFVQFTDEMIANNIMCQDDEAYADIVYDEDGEEKKKYFEGKIYEQGEYIVTFGYNNSKVMNVYKRDDEDEELIERDIPWCLLKVEDEEGNTIYNTCDEL